MVGVRGFEPPASASRTVSSLGSKYLILRDFYILLFGNERSFVIFFANNVHFGSGVITRRAP